MVVVVTCATCDHLPLSAAVYVLLSTGFEETGR